jgi:CubicO group peptidase (beta-lactamase class C family)
MRQPPLSLFNISFLLLLLVFIAPVASPCPLSQLHASTPADQIDQLPKASSSGYVVDTEKISDVVSRIERGDFGNIHSLIILHENTLILEKYFKGWSREKLHPMYSATKSVTSALIGIAIAQEKIKGVSQKVLDFFPEYTTIANLDSNKESLTLKHLLTMSAGFPWNEGSVPILNPEGRLNPENAVCQMAHSKDWIHYVLDLPVVSTPGTTWVYNSGASHVLSGILKNATGLSAEAFAANNLFKPLGITTWEWKTDPNGLSNTGGAEGGLFLRPVDMALFGYLYLNKGTFKGRQIIPESWVSESTARHMEAFTADYGYQWWTRSDVYLESEEPLSFFYAFGFGGQFVFVVPAMDMVAVTTGKNEQSKGQEAIDLFLNSILPAIKKR